MIGQVFPVTRAFNRLLLYRWRAEPCHAVTRSRSKVAVHSARSRLGCHQRDQWLAPSPQARADKITQLRQAVENRDYCVSPEQIAEKIVQEVLVAMLT
jgi:anti-sigma28 factor (negative regulator of flagellin synthesis)